MTPKYPEKAVRRAVFAGSFNPYTVGHADIVRRALAIFDEVVVCVGYNADKVVDANDIAARVDAIRRVYYDCPQVTVESWSGLTMDFVRKCRACALVRGVRSVKDYEYERDMADANREIGGIDTVLLFADPKYAWVSSSLVRELDSYGRDIASLLPRE